MSENLIIRFLQHDLTEEESIQFKDWLSANPENMELFRTFKEAWSLSGGNAALTDAEAETEFQKFRYRFFQSAGDKSFWHYQALKYAAVFALAFMLSFFIFKLSDKKDIALLSEYNEITTKPGEQSQITLADGSKIWINSCSNLKYPADLTSEHIEMYLDGEAFFDLKKLPNRKITIHTSRLNINVLGTAFNLKSYADDNIIETTLVRGKVAISYSSGNRKSKTQIYLSPNQSATYFKKTDSLKFSELTEHRVQETETLEGLEQLALKNKFNVVVEESINTESQVSWVDGKFTFNKETFESLAKRMERKYNVKIYIEDKNLRRARFNGTFDKESIEQALKALSYPVPFKYDIIKDSISIYPK